MARESIWKGVLRIRLENTEYVIDYAKKNKMLLKILQDAGKSGIQEAAFNWSISHNDEFGDPKDSRLTTELYDVFWDKVWYAIRPKK